MGNSDRRLDRYFMVVHVSEFIWCHGTNCHKSHTTDRVRGSKGSKVLRTRKIKLNKSYKELDLDKNDLINDASVNLSINKNKCRPPLLDSTGTSGSLYCCIVSK